ncbi:MAG: alpha/beta fold hydrolase [Deltaproteobacteria bacterium]|nr:alpha/beta fold hydrolase [Deltaproteobacteria bacterium]
MGAEHLYAMVHLPEVRRRGPLGFVFCPPFADEAFRTHRELVVFARRLAAEGCPVLRFDYRGCGESTGEFETFSLADWTADVRRAIDLLSERAQVQAVALLGLRFGAGLAASVAGQDPRVVALALWAPIVDGAAYFQFLLQSQMAHELGNFGKVTTRRADAVKTLQAGGTFDLMAYRVTAALYRELIAFDPWEAETRRPAHALILSVEGDRTRSQELKALPDRYPGCVHTLVKEKHFWFDKVYQNPRNLYDHTLRWVGSLPRTGTLLPD